jgi:squalene synthase HpnC
MGDAAPGKLAVATGREAVAPLPDERAVMARSSSENFSVATLLLPRRVRAHLLAIYGYARLVDQIGDDAPGDRLAQLEAVEGDLERIYAGAAPAHPVLARLAPTIRSLELPRQPFLALIEANRQDQTTATYATYDELLAYCALSANPVGELVLRVFGCASEERIRLSDAVCSALQLAEHWQDVAEDYAAGRIYLPEEDLAAFAVEPGDLGAAHTGAALAALLAFEVDRARMLLASGAPLVGTLRGSARLAVAGYVAGGSTALDAIEAAGYDVLAGAPSGGKAARLRETARLFRRGT